MNNLTKEELIKVKELIELAYRHALPFESLLLKKIQSLIDSYHEDNNDSMA